MTTRKKFSQETKERAVRLVLDTESEHNSQWAAIRSISDKVGCSAETLRNWVRQAERDEGKRAGPRRTRRRGSRNSKERTAS